MVEIKNLEKGDSLIKEGENSTAMYWVQNGSFRLFKKKGSGSVELGVVHSGEIIGELSFLDNQPRSASAEALSKSQVVEIPRGNFDKFMQSQPDWVRSLLKTLVARVRSANNRLREVESNSMVYVHDDLGRMIKQHEFLSNKDVLKLCSAMVLIGARHGEAQPDGSLKVRAGWLQVQAGSILSMPIAKIQSFSDVLQDAAFIRLEKQSDHADVFILEPDLLERFMYWLNEEHGKPEDKRLHISSKGMAILDAINEFADLGAAGEAETTPVDLQAVFKKSAAATGERVPFQFEDFKELVKAGFGDELRASAGNVKSTNLKLKFFLKTYPMLAVKTRFDQLNAKKRGESEHF